MRRRRSDTSLVSSVEMDADTDPRSYSNERAIAGPLAVGSGLAGPGRGPGTMGPGSTGLDRGSTKALTPEGVLALPKQPPASVSPARARDLSIELAAATDELNDALLRAERNLAGLKLGVAASIELERVEEEDASITWVRFLVFRKQSDHWRLLVESGPEDDPRSWSASPLVNTSREVRLLAARRLPDLVQEMHQVAEAQIAEVKQATSSIDMLLVTLDKTRAR